MNVRPATHADIDTLTALIERSVRGLQRETYSALQIDLALSNVYGVDTTLVDDGTYFVIEDAGRIVAGGGWSRRAKLHGGDQFCGHGRPAQLLDPQHDAAKIRAFFVEPDAARQGRGSLLLVTCERAAAVAGFTRAELSATLAGVPFYAARGYREVGRADVELPDDVRLPVVRMERWFDGDHAG